jgi:hypothetical protein
MMGPIKGKSKAKYYCEASRRLSENHGRREGRAILNPFVR